MPDDAETTAKGDGEKADVNDYSRFKDVKDSDDEDSSSSSSDAKTELDLSVDESLVRAESCKLSGNSSFREKNNKEAIKFYKKALDLLKPMEGKSFPAILEGHVVKRDQLISSLLLNQAAALNREERWKESIECCTKAEKVVKAEDNDTWVKLYFRRATAHNKRSDLDLAKKDYASVLKLDPKNRAALKEFTNIRKKLAIIKAKDRKSFGKAFSSGGMYEDKEEERVKRAKKQALEKEEEKKEYEAEKAKLEAAGDPIESFEDWRAAKKKAKEAEEKAKKAKEEKERKKREAERAKEREERRLKELENPPTDEVELDEDDLAAINDVKAKGYCHFRREQSQEEKELLRRSLTPSRISEADQDTETATNSSVSAWNQAGTWEEKDVAEQAKKSLKSGVSAVKIVEDGVLIKVKDVSTVTGEAQIVMVNGKKGALYDMTLELKWEAEVQDSKELLYDIDNDSDISADSDDEKEAAKTNKFIGKLKYTDISNGVENQQYDCSISCDSVKQLNENEKLRTVLTKFQGKVTESIAHIIEKQLIE